MKQRRNSSGRFERCVDSVSARGRARSPRGVCAAAGRKKYGKAKFQAMAAAGRRKAGRRKNPLVVPPAVLAEYGGPIIRTAGQELQLIPRGGFKLLPNSRIAAAGGKRSRGNRGKPSGGNLGKTGRVSPVTAANTGKRKRGNLGKTGKTGKTGKRNNPGSRRNPLDAAQEVYQGFHGRPSTETVEITTRIHEHKYLSGIGELVTLIILSPDGYKVTATEFGGALLCQNEKRTQLFIEGGDQSLDVGDFGIREPIHEAEVLGELLQVWYYTVKDHLGDEGGEAIYRHKLKKYAFRRRPTMIYDTVNHLISFAGGNYSIPDEGIKD